MPWSGEIYATRWGSCGHSTPSRARAPSWFALAKSLPTVRAPLVPNRRWENRVVRLSWHALLLVAFLASSCPETRGAPGSAMEDRNAGAVIVRVSEGENGKRVPITNVLVVGKHTGPLVDTSGSAVVGGL